MQHTGAEVMRRVVLVLIVVLTTSGAIADIREFRNFSLDVPEGWTAQEEGAVVRVVAEDGSASLTITADDPKGRAIGDLAAEFSLELGGTMPEKDEDGSYTFELNGGRSQAVITGDEEFYMLIVGTGIEATGEVLGEILDSLEMK